MGFLKLIGAVSAAEHSKAISHRDETYLKERARLIDERDAANRLTLGAETRFKKAVKDIAGLTEDVQAAEKVADARAKIIAEQRAEIAALRPDAEKWRDRAARELQRGQAKRDAAAKGRGEVSDDELRDFAKALSLALEKYAADGTKLLSVTYNYPRGGRAWEVGFLFGAGFVSAASFMVFIGLMITKAFS